MAAIDDLNTAIASLTTVSAEVVAALGTNDDAAIETATTAVNSAVTSLQGALPAAPAPAPVEEAPPAA